jgi:hypothetical protein
LSLLLALLEGLSGLLLAFFSGLPLVLLEDPLALLEGLSGLLLALFSGLPLVLL